MSRDAVAFRHATHAAVCDRFVAWELGTAVFADRAPTFWDYNVVRVEGEAADLDAPALIAAADRVQADLGHRRVEVERHADGERLRPGLEAAGWTAERLVWMQLDGPARGPHAPAEITEEPFTSTRALRNAWYCEEDMGAGEAGERFLHAEESVAARRGLRALLTRSAAGEPIGYVTLAVIAAGAEIAQVYVDAAHRGRGLGGALVAAGVDAAGTRRTWIVADDEGDPKRLYARLGFRPVWLQHVFTRRPR